MLLDLPDLAPRLRRLAVIAAVASLSFLLTPGAARAQVQTLDSPTPTERSMDRPTPYETDTDATDPRTSARQRDLNGSSPGTRSRARRDATDSTLDDGSDLGARSSANMPPARYVPGEFERFVQRLVGPARPGTPRITRFGAELVTPTVDERGGELSPVPPADYVVAPGDEILLTLWGSVVADLRLVVDRGGRVSIPRVGAIQVAGVRHADLQAVVEKRVAQVFRNFQVSVALGQLRGVRVFVTGFVQRPGTYTVGALSTVVNALMKAGGPSAAGSFRQIDLKRGSALVARFDLYELLLKGDRSADRIVQAGDAIHVGAVGTQVALIGSVNQPAVFEIKADESVADLVAMAGGFTPVADRSRLSVERLDDRANVRIRELQLPAENQALLASGDVLRAFSAVSASLPVERQNKRVLVEGEVVRPGEYVMPPSSSIGDALRAAGGLTAAAYIYGTEFTRESVRLTQQTNYDRALRDLETEFTRATATQRTANAEEVASQTARSAATDRLISRLRAIRPSGRIVLQLPPESQGLPDLALEDGDRLTVPPRPTTIGVFGSVFNGGSYLYTDGRSIDEYLRLAGGPTRGADEGSVFVIRANGSVVSALQTNKGWFRGERLAGLTAEAGDTIFVPEELDKTTFLQAAKDWTQILSQFALGVAAIQVLGN
ncbi:MAG: SLBB domain-containing protein [Rubrivivax sp.]